ncbi:MAG: sensor domain-containing diguanylate cyclase, partial [Candidatus Omnitrophota bacterium]
GSEADIMDKWVLRHNLSLLVEDMAEDFRFDCTKVAAFRERNIRSVMVSPLSVGEKVKGTMKVESKAPSGFSLDDSRILRSICDLGAVVLERADLFQKAQDLAIRDSLTSLFLREHFLVRLKEEIGQAYLTGTRIGILMLDIDDFKSINDTYGHVVGDLVLKKLAIVLNEVVGDTNSSICRFGGEEFTLFIVDCTRDGLYEVGKRIRKKVYKSIVSFRRKHISFTVSLGGVLFPEDGNDPTGLIDRADQLLYKAKREGKNRLCLP